MFSHFRIELDILHVGFRADLCIDRFQYQSIHPTMSSADSRGGHSSTRWAFKPTPVISDFKGTITCVAYYSQRILIGTADGRLVLYDTRRGQQSPVASTSMSHRRAIDKITVVPHIRTILILSDGQLTARAATDLEPLASAFHEARGVVRTFCVNQRGPPHYRVCLALKKQIMLFEYAIAATKGSSSKEYCTLREFQLADTPERLQWYRNKLFVGFRREYTILNDKTGEMTPLTQVSPMKDPRHMSSGSGANHTGGYCPLVKLLPREQILVAAMDKVGMIMDFNGEPLEKHSISWSGSPHHVVYTSPYLMACIPHVGLEVHSIVDHEMIQLIPMPSIVAISGNGMKWDMEPRAASDPEDVVLVATPSTVYQLEAMPLERQIADLLDQNRIDEAQELMRVSLMQANSSSDRMKHKMKRFYKQAGVSCLSRLDFRQGTELLMQGEFDPRELLAYFPKYNHHAEGGFAFEPVVLVESVWPRLGNAALDIGHVISDIQKRVNPQPGQTSEQLYAEAEGALVKLLEHTLGLGNDSRNISSQDARVVQTCAQALFRVYVSRGPSSELERMLKSSRHASELDLSEAKNVLSETPEALAWLYAGRKMHRDALETLQSLGCLGKGKSDESFAVQMSVEILLKSSNPDFVWEYSVWILERAPEAGLKLLASRKPALASQDVLDHLKSVDSHLAQRYLESMVEQDLSLVEPTSKSNPKSSNSNDPTTMSRYDEDVAESQMPLADEAYHTRLALEYLEEVLDLVKKDELDSPEGRLGKARSRLLKFLKAPGSNYDPVKLLGKIKNRTQLRAEYTTLCGKAGRHKDALKLLIPDYDAAEAYCLACAKENRHRRKRTSGSASKTNPNNSSAFSCLFELCMDQDSKMKKLGNNVNSVYEYALSLLERHARECEPLVILKALPDDTPIPKVETFLRSSLSTHATHARELSITRSLRNVYNLQVQCAQVGTQQRRVEVNEDTLCGACRKRIGDIVFAVYPNDTIVHYKCTNGTLDQCPVTGEKF